MQWHLELDGEESPVADVSTRRLNVFVMEGSGGSIYRCECGLHVECHIILGTYLAVVSWPAIV